MFEDLQGKKVAFLRPYFALGGVESICFETIRQLSKYGVEFTFFTSKIFFDLSNQGIPNVKIRALPNVSLRPNGFPRDGASFLRKENLNYVVKELDENEIDVLVFLWHTSIIPKILKSTRRTKIVFWLHSMPLWEISHREAIWFNANRQSNIKKIPKIFRPLIKTLDLYRFSKKIKAQYREQINFYDKFITLSKSYKDDLVEEFGCNISDKITYLINSISINYSPNLDKKKEVLFAGRLVLLDKQADRLLSIWKKVQDDIPQWKLRICGDGWMKDELVIKAKEMGLERYEFCGNQNDMEPFYNNSAVMILTSNYEGWPMSLIEAQNNGVVPIAFDCCSGVQNIIGKEDKAGVLVTPFDEEEYANKLKRLCLDQEYRLSLQKAVLAKRHEYTFEQNLPLWEDIICS